MFAILVTSLFEDCQDNIVLNYLTNKIFYNNGYAFELISGIITQAGVTNATIINNMWFDDNYGFINPSGFLTWVKIVMRKNISTGIGKYLIGYFNITDQIMQNLVINANAWLVLQVANETSTLPSRSLPLIQVRNHLPAVLRPSVLGQRLLHNAMGSQKPDQTDRQGGVHRRLQRHERLHSRQLRVLH